jgi:S-adenosylmethionine hydrolase
VYAYTGARLAAGVISFEQVGHELPARVVTIPHQQARYENGVAYGNIPILDVQYGNVWTNIDRATFEKLKIAVGQPVEVRITKGNAVIAELSMSYLNSFGSAPVGAPLLYLNSLDNVALAINQGSFAEQHHVASGPEWSIRISPKH